MKQIITEEIESFHGWKIRGECTEHTTSSYSMRDIAVKIWLIRGSQEMAVVNRREEWFSHVSSRDVYEMAKADVRAMLLQLAEISDGQTMPSSSCVNLEQNDSAIDWSNQNVTNTPEYIQLQESLNKLSADIADWTEENDDMFEKRNGIRVEFGLGHNFKIEDFLKEKREWYKEQYEQQFNNNELKPLSESEIKNLDEFIEKLKGKRKK